MADTDSDGRVGTGELSALLRTNLAGYVNMPLVERDIVAADTNRDGIITFTGREAFLDSSKSNKSYRKIDILLSYRMSLPLCSTSIK